MLFILYSIVYIETCIHIIELRNKMEIKRNLKFKIVNLLMTRIFCRLEVFVKFVVVSFGILS